MHLQIIGIFVQAHLLTKILTVQAPALEENNHDKHDEQKQRCLLGANGVGSL